MKRYLILVLFISSVLYLFGQGEYLKEKIEKPKLHQIKNKTLVDYNLLKQTVGKVTIIEFWETWCGPCIQGMYHLKELKDKFSDELEIICVSCDDLGKTISFIEKNKFPFTFIYDKEKYLAEQVFPHSGIPHSILVDKTGKIQAATLPGFIKDEAINNLITDKQVDIPNKQLFNPENLSEEKSENTLINFELQSSQLGDRNYFRTTSHTRSKRILTDYTGGYKDTIENITESTVAGRNILELYQYAYENIPLTRFIYDKELSYINSYLPDKRYTMIFSSSDLFGNHYSILINQLNSIFGLKTGIQEKEVDVLILDSISTNTGNIKEAGDNTEAGRNSTISKLLKYQIKAFIINSKDIVNTLEDFFEIPVETEIPPTNFYDIDIDIEKDYIKGITDNVDPWLELLKENGLILRKDKKVVKFIEIEKSN